MPKVEEICVWQWNHYHGCYNTGCDHTWPLGSNIDPFCESIQTGQRYFCPYCGQQVKAGKELFKMKLKEMEDKRRISK